MEQIRVLFLGASRFVGLMERFKAAAQKEGVEVELYSLEDNSPWHVVAAAGICQVVSGPRFADPAFAPFLLDLVKRQRINLVIPHIDPATVSLSKMKPELGRLGINAVVSTDTLCSAMHDKLQADALFRQWNLPVPSGESWPQVAKPRFGSSSRGHVIFRDPDEFHFWRARNRAEDYLIQPFLKGTEYSVDGFVSATGRVLGAVARVRVVVSGGEVMVAKTDRNEAVLGVTERVLAKPGWHGPLNIQVMQTDSGPVLLEVNPRFGSGTTCAIEAGLDSPRWLIREFLGRSLPQEPLTWRSGLCMTRCRKDYFLWLS